MPCDVQWHSMVLYLRNVRYVFGGCWSPKFRHTTWILSWVFLVIYVPLFLFVESCPIPFPFLLLFCWGGWGGKRQWFFLKLQCSFPLSPRIPFFFSSFMMPRRVIETLLRSLPCRCCFLGLSPWIRHCVNFPVLRGICRKPAYLVNKSHHKINLPCKSIALWFWNMPWVCLLCQCL